MFTRGLLDAPRRLIDGQVLSPVGVLPEHQRQGVGSVLIRAGLEVMIKRRVPVVFLEGDPGYYSRFGFQAGGPQGFRKPSLRVPDAVFQAIRLAGHEPWMPGTLVYAERSGATIASGVAIWPSDRRTSAHTALVASASSPSGHS